MWVVDVDGEQPWLLLVCLLFNEIDGPVGAPGGVMQVRRHALIYIPALLQWWGSILHALLLQPSDVLVVVALWSRLVRPMEHAITVVNTTLACFTYAAVTGG